MITLLAIGDLKDWDSYKKFIRQKKYFRKHSIKLKKVSYDSVLNNKLPNVKTEKLVIFPFFCFEYWDNNIETKKYKGVYGNRIFYFKFQKFWKTIEKKIREYYKGKKIFFVNNPKKIYYERDKELTKKILKKNKIPVPQPHYTHNLKDVLKLVNQGKKLYIKVRYGSMGKGITYLEKNRWLTNFRFRRGKIISKKSDYGWTFRDITGNKPFLKTLLKEDIIIEDAINPFLLKGRKFDLRLYVCFGKVLYIYPRSNDCVKITTNISQGATGEDKKFLNSVPPKLMKLSIKHAIKSTRVMGLNFAGVDIMPGNSGGKIKVIEVNAYPGFPRMRSFNLSKYIIKEIASQKWK